MFASDANGRTMDRNCFMDSEIRFSTEQLGNNEQENGNTSTIRCSHEESDDDILSTYRLTDRPIRVKDVSRLWLYRNGMSPPEER